MMKTRRLARFCLGASIGVLAAASGCRTATPVVPAPVPAAAAVRSAARALYDSGRYDEALTAWIDDVRGRPRTPADEALRHDILKALSEQRLIEAEGRRRESLARMGVDAVTSDTVPSTYGARRYQARTLHDHRAPPGPMRAILDQPITIHVSGAELATLIRALAADDNINIVADRDLGGGKTLDMALDNVPLREVLDYLARNFGIRFFIGQNLIWATAADVEGPLETRIFRLHRGLQFHTSDWPKTDVAQSATARPLNRHDLSFQATELPQAETYIETLIKQFVPASPGAAVHFDKNTHTLFVRDTPANLALVESIVSAVDVTPPQVLIEARFIEASVDDLQELGIDWVLDSPLVVGRGGVRIDGIDEQRPSSQITGGPDGSVFRVTPPRERALTDRLGGAVQGLNLTYQGILTEPMFSAVLHAIEIAGEARTLSVPRVTTVNNNPAKLRQGNDLLYYEEFESRAFSLVDVNNRAYSVTALMPKGRPVLAELGITLVAVPSVGEDGDTISLLLTPTISELDSFNFYTEQDPATTAIQQVSVKLPTISRREVQTKVIVRSGETVVMGGLIEAVSGREEYRVPILGSLPLVGALFRRTEVVERRRNLIIFVTATVISERGESLLAGVPGDIE